MLKRSNEYSQIRREDYDVVVEGSKSPASSSFPVADAATLARRRLLRSSNGSGKKLKGKKKEDKESSSLFRMRMYALNESFVAFCEKEISEEACRDYAFYAREIANEFAEKKTTVLSFGSGDCGQLGHGTNSERDTIVTKPRPIMAFSRGIRISQVACGGLHNVACSFDGAAYTWGCNDDGSLGRDGDEDALYYPTRLPLFGEKKKNHPAIASVAAGDTQSFVVTRDGDVYGWGCYKDKEGKQWFDCNEALAPKRKQTTPLLIEGLRKVKKVVCGAAFNAALRTDGILMTWGIGQVGELGRKVASMTSSNGDYDLEIIRREYLAPRSIHSNVKCVGAGAYHLLVATNKEVKACGLNNYGQLGDGTSNSSPDEQFKNFVTVKNLPSGIVALDGGMHHSLCLTNKGDVYSWGRSDYGQLGLGSDIASKAGGSVLVPTKVDSLKDIVSIAAGSNHNLVTSSAASVFAWGYGDMSALGIGTATGDKPEPTKLETIPPLPDNGGSSIGVSQVAAGGQHSALILYPN